MSSKLVHFKFWKISRWSSLILIPWVCAHSAGLCGVEIIYSGPSSDSVSGYSYRELRESWFTSWPLLRLNRIKTNWKFPGLRASWSSRLWFSWNLSTSCFSESPLDAVQLNSDRFNTISTRCSANSLHKTLGISGKMSDDAEAHDNVWYVSGYLLIFFASFACEISSKISSKCQTQQTKNLMNL